MSEVQGGLGIGENEPLGAVDEYQFEPIKGYPMLQWHGKRPFRSTHYYPAQLKEVHGPEAEGWRNKIYWGDNLQVMSHLLKQYRGQVQLVYIDPPFDSKAEYKKRIQIQGTQTDGSQSAFEDKQYGDIWTNDLYLQFMYERLVVIRELISPSGSCYLHCDPNQSHHLRCLLDEVFGEQSFRNEIVWQRTSARSDSKTYNQIHDTLFFYSKALTAFTWNRQYQDYSDEYIESKFTQRDSAGKRYQLTDMTSPHPRPNMVYEWMGFAPPHNGWRYSRDTMTELHSRGRIWYPEDKNKRPRLIRYLDDNKGRPLQSVWTDIFPVNSQASEREGYPTQKPEALLERIIRASSNPGDLVFDCFMGSGTTQAVAMKLGRRFVGADINLGAIQITTKRLLQVAEDLVAAKNTNQMPQQAAISYEDSEDLKGVDDDGESAIVGEPAVFYTGFEVYNVNNYDVFRNPVQAKELLLLALEVQPLAAASVFDGTRGGRMVKIMPVNRIATRADLNDLLNNIDHKAMDRLYQANPNQVVEKITLVCMGHEPDLAACLKQELYPYKVDVEVVDVLRDRQDLQFKRDAEARVKVKGGKLTVEAFYPMNLLQKLSLQKEAVQDWRELVESVMVDWNYDGAVLTPALVDIPDRDELVKGVYSVPEDAGTIRVKITDLLSESWEGTVA